MPTPRFVYPVDPSIIEDMNESDVITDPSQLGFKDPMQILIAFQEQDEIASFEEFINSLDNLGD